VLLNYYNQYYRKYFRSGRLDVEGIKVTQRQYPIIYQYVKYSWENVKKIFSPVSFACIYISITENCAKKMYAGHFGYTQII